MVAIDHTTTSFVLGLTGPIACGKTTVGDYLLELGAVERLDADRAVHALLGPGSEISERIRDRFGDDVMQGDGGVDRARLADHVFCSPTELQALEKIVHPAVRQVLRAQIEALRSRSGVIVLDAVKLLQSELLGLCDTVWVVRCSPASQLQRLTGPRNMFENQARARLAAQPSFDSPRVAVVLENSGSLADLQRQTRAAWESLPYLR